MLDLNDLGDNFAPGVTSAIGAFMAEAAGVCLERNTHSHGVDMRVSGYVDTTHELRWPPITDVARRGWADLAAAAEWGAAGVAVLLTHRETHYTVVEQSRKDARSGFDYWLGDKSDEGLEKRARLEVSGVLQGGEPAMNNRFPRKARQTMRSDFMGIPAYVAVVEFSQPAARFEERIP